MSTYRGKILFLALSFVFEIRSIETVGQDNALGLSENVKTSLFQYCQDDTIQIESFECLEIQRILDLIEKNDNDNALQVINKLTFNNDSLDKRLFFYLNLLKAKVFYDKSLLNGTISLYQWALSYSRKNPSQYLWFEERIYERLASLYLEMEMFDSAVYYYNKFVFETKSAYHPKFLTIALQNLGICYFHLDRLDSAKRYLDESLAVNEQAKDTIGLAIAYMNIANLYYEQYLDELAIPLFVKGYEFAQYSRDQRVMRNAALNMAVIEENRGNFETALTYKKEQEKLDEELWNRDKVWELAEREKAFELNLKEKEIELLSEREKLNLAELKTKSLQRNTAIASSVLFILITMFAFIGYRRIKAANTMIARQNRKLETLNNTKNRLFSIVSHDLKSPVLALQNSQKRLSSSLELKSNDDIKRALEENERSAASTYRLLNNLLHWSLDQANQLVFMPETVKLSQLIAQIVYDYKASLQNKNITLYDHAVNTKSEIIVDLNAMKMVLRNLLDNAIKFTQENGSISITGTEEDSHTIIGIRDTGVGMPEDDLMKLKSKLSCQELISSKSGTGLGLALCQSIISRHSGMLEIESMEGEGTLIKLLLPKDS